MKTTIATLTALFATVAAFPPFPFGGEGYQHGGGYPNNYYGYQSPSYIYPPQYQPQYAPQYQPQYAPPYVPQNAPQNNGQQPPQPGYYQQGYYPPQQQGYTNQAAAATGTNQDYATPQAAAAKPTDGSQ